MRHARSLAALASSCAIVLAFFVARAANAPRPALEIWGALPGDVIEIDGVATTIKAGTTPRPFEGEPLPGNAALTQEVSAGRHAVVVHREGCAVRTFSVEVLGTYKRSIVLTPTQATHCGLPAPPPRAP